ncbi:restriction endonuclease subunit S [Zobellia russellii]|uniref:restriction endonuclease subunit S n=1 Tax=Zobellia russellii TaxID=248907 RepID=UPI001BFFCA3C|nr:restriction endonuclease subunit S [Zobellia russellii]MBT9190412.1 restriction endonuclease subunit S [Zobellia russellii]
MKEDWIECTLDKLIDDDGLFKDGDWVEKKDQDPNGQVRLIQLADIGDGNFRDKSAKYLNLQRAKEMNCSFLKQGDILIARMPEPLGRCTFFPFDEDEKFITAVDVAILRPKNESVYNNFLLHQINSPSIRNNIDKLKSGTTRKRISRKNLNKIDFRFPSLIEQKAVVKKIEELFSSLDSGIADLKKAQDQLVIYRQAVLKKAFEGELTNKKQKNKSLPDGWRTETVREVCENIKVGIVIKPTNFYYKGKDGIKAFRSANVREFKVNDSNWVYFSKEGNEINKRTQVHTGDVLLVRSGYPGTSCVVTEKFNNSNAIDVLIATPNQEKVLPNFLCTFNNSPLAKGLFNKASRGVAQKHLNVGVYGKLLISYPNIEEQLKILKEIESRLSVCDTVEKDIADSLEKAQALRQSILKKAFEGTLLREAEIAKCKADKYYEPARVLLERIKKEKKK